LLYISHAIAIIRQLVSSTICNAANITRRGCKGLDIPATGIVAEIAGKRKRIQMLYDLVGGGTYEEMKWLTEDRRRLRGAIKLAE